MITKILTAGIMLVVLTITVLKLPVSLGKALMRIPSWIQSLGLHFGYGSWVGGVTGHLIAGFMSIPWFFISELFLRPRLLGMKRPTFSDMFSNQSPRKAA